MKQKFGTTVQDVIYKALLSIGLVESPTMHAIKNSNRGVENMDNFHLLLKSFIDEHPSVQFIQVVYSDASYFVLVMRYLDKDSRVVKGNSKAIRYKELAWCSENEWHMLLTHILSEMYDECQYMYGE